MAAEKWEIQLEAALAEKWLTFCEVMKFSDNVPLSQRITSFINSATHFVGAELGLDPADQKTRTITTLLAANAIITARTHSRYEVSAAYSEMGQQFAKEHGLRNKFRVMERLNTPYKRVGAVVLLAGIFMLVPGFIYILDTTWPFEDAVERYFDAVFRTDRRLAQRYWAAAWGTYLTLAGALTSFWYDKTLKPFATWIKSGSLK